MPSEFEARRDIVETGKRLWQRGYVAANDGNISARLGDRVLVTPTGLSKGFLRPDDIVLVTLTGDRLSGGRKPTSELAMHLRVYDRRPDVLAVVHAHPPNATGFAVAGVPMAQCVLPEVILTLGDVPLTEYATPSTEEVARAIDAHICRYNALLLRNHGALTLGTTIEEAYFRMETVEHFAQITIAARALGGEAPLSVDEVRKLLSAGQALGLGSGTEACVSCGACEGTESSADSGPDEEEVVRAVLERLKKQGVGS